MNLKMIRPKNETEGLLLSITKNCETLIEQTHRKAEETLEDRLTKSREVFHFNLLIQIKGHFMIGLTDLEVNNSILNKTDEKKNKFELYTDTFDESSFEERKDYLEEILNISNITSEHLQADIFATCIISAYKKTRNRKEAD